MKRLLTFGCSYTGYEFPTWAHLLGLSYDYFENWGLMGTGNRSIAERIAEAHAHGKIDSNTTIVVQWTTPYRNDFHKTVDQGLPWRTRGNLFNQPYLYDRKWVDNFYDETSYLMHTLNAIVLAQGLLQSTGCTWYMTTNTNYDKLIEDHPRLQNYKWVTHPDHWLMPIGPTNPNQAWSTRDYAELHPGIMQYLEWLKTTPLQPSEQADLWANELESNRIKYSYREDLLAYIRNHKKEPVWPHQLHGL